KPGGHHHRRQRGESHADLAQARRIGSVGRMLRQVDNRKRKNQKDSETKLHVITRRKIVWRFLPGFLLWTALRCPCGSGWWEYRIGSRFYERSLFAQAIGVNRKLVRSSGAGSFNQSHTVEDMTELPS